MNMYELEGNLLTVLRLAESADPDDRQVFDDTINSLKDGIADKAIGYGKVIKQLESDGKQLKEKMDHDKERLASIQSNARRLKMTLQQAMESAGMDKAKDIDLSVWIQNNPVSVRYVDESKIPNDFMVTTSSLDKKAVKEALKSGEDVPGAELKQDRSIRIR